MQNFVVNFEKLVSGLLSSSYAWHVTELGARPGLKFTVHQTIFDLKGTSLLVIQTW